MTTVQPHTSATDATVPDGWTVEPLTGTIGAVIHGADHYLRDRADEVSDYLGDFLIRSLTTSDN